MVNSETIAGGHSSKAEWRGLWRVARRFAPFLADADADWSDNAFHLPASQAKTITFRPWQKLSLAQARKKLSVTTLVDAY